MDSPKKQSTLKTTDAMFPSSNHQEDLPKFGSNPITQDKEDNKQAYRDDGKLPVPTSKSSKKELQCKFCNKRFPSSQALGGHQNAHKEERAAAKRENILTMASAYRDSNSNVQNLYSPFGNRVSWVQPPLPMIHKPPQVAIGHGHVHNISLGKRVMNNPQPTMHQLQTLMADRSGFRDHNIDLSAYRIRTPNFGLQPSLCDNENFDKVNPSPREPQNNTEEELDLTLKL